MRTEMASGGGAIAAGWTFLKNKWWAVLGVSALIVVPCLWHQHIEAGDLGSHVYNVWLAQLIKQGLAPGLYLARQWDNVLVDILLLRAGNWVGLASAEKIVVSLCALTFFWGVFAFVGTVSGKAPWFLAPWIAMLAYGYSFHMGFLNYYVSVGLACFCLAVTWGWRLEGGSRVVSSLSIADSIAALLLAGLTLSAHPLGLVWIVGMLAYRIARPWISAWGKLVIPVAEIVGFYLFRHYVHLHNLSVDWNSAPPLYALSGADQLNLFGERYVWLSWVALAVCAIWVVVDFARRRKEGVAAYWKSLVLPVELYLLFFATTTVLPENFHVSVYAAWIGLVVSRLTLITAILGLAILAGTQAERWHLYAGVALAAVFFTFVYQDTGLINRVERNAEAVLSTVPAGARIVPNIFADPEWRVEFVVHLAERACVARCFVYSNYEPPSRQFRVRVAPEGSRIVTSDIDDAEDMQAGNYEVQAEDLPLKQLYQCDALDATRLCLRDVAAGQRLDAVIKRPE